MANDAIDQAIAVLNRLHKADPTVMQTLIFYRVPCNEAVAEDPTIQVGVGNGSFEVGILGIINGLFGVDKNSMGFIAVNINPTNGQIINFSRMIPN